MWTSVGFHTFVGICGGIPGYPSISPDPRITCDLRQGCFLGGFDTASQIKAPPPAGTRGKSGSSWELVGARGRSWWECKVGVLWDEVEKI